MKRTNGVNRRQWQLRLECIQNLHLQGVEGIENQGCSTGVSFSFSPKKIEQGIIRIGCPNIAEVRRSWLAFGWVGGGRPSGMVSKRKSGLYQISAMLQSFLT
ncbi:hypothetical protein C5167_027107 [Papaver somniferum]|nr:hypothetical protein C5167_027107 [Papaver somniferum]